MGIDLGTFLSVFATTMVGNLLSLDPGFSLGGQTPAVEDILGNVLGLIGAYSHLNIIALLCMLIATQALRRD